MTTASLTARDILGDGGRISQRLSSYESRPQQLEMAQRSRETFQQALKAAGHRGEISTEIAQGPVFYYAEDYHQQYLAKNPNGYCGLGGTGVSCPVAWSAAAG